MEYLTGKEQDWTKHSMQCVQLEKIFLLYRKHTETKSTSTSTQKAQCIAPPERYGASNNVTALLQLHPH